MKLPLKSSICPFLNEKVDKNAKESLNLEETVFKISYVNFKPFINEYISDKWQTIWNGANFDNTLVNVNALAKARTYRLRQFQRYG